MVLERFIELLIMTVPALLIMITSILYIGKMFYNEERRMDLELALRNNKQLLPSRIRGYERLLVFLERIRIENLISRCIKDNLTVGEFRIIMVQDVSREFDHNISQQLFVTIKSWNIIRNAKMNLISSINLMSQKFDSDASALVFSQFLLDAFENIDESLVDIAIRTLKDEFQTNFR